MRVGKMKMLMYHIAGMAAMLLMALSFAACSRPDVIVEESTELSVSIYIPDMGTTKAETGSVGALSAEKVFTSLQLWVFIHGGTKDGHLVGYKGFTAAQLANTGLLHSAITRFAMPLDRDMFNALTAANARVDVYALANAASATTAALGEGTSRSALDGIVMSGNTFGAESLIKAVPATGLPMSGVLKEASVTGDYPVLNVSTVTLSRAVSKIRFVFCQQGKPASGTDPAVPSNPYCVIKSITFSSEIADEEKLFTDQKYGDTDNLFEINGYTPLDATLAGENGAPLVSNADMSITEHPDDLLFQSAGHGTESAREYEERLNAAIAQSSQLGPIYIRETDKLISGTIVYNVGEGDIPVTFSMPEGDLLTRNHSWILYAYFAETTRTLQFKIVVLPWDKNTYDFDFKNWTVNVVRRFTIPEKEPQTYTKVQNSNGYFDVYFWHTLDNEPNIVTGDIIIDSPVGQTLHIVPVAGARDGCTKIDGIFTITPMEAVIYPNYQNPEDGRTEDCKIEFKISCNPGNHTAAELQGNYIDIHFCVEIGDNERWIDLDSESLDHYRVFLKEDWVHWENW